MLKFCSTWPFEFMLLELHGGCRVLFWHLSQYCTASVCVSAYGPVSFWGFAFAVQPYREVRPESGLSIYESISYHDPIFGPGRGRGRREGEKRVLLYLGKARHTITPLTK